MDGSDPVANYRAIRQELELYSPALAARPELILVTKLDMTGSAAAAERISAELCREVLPISAVTGKGIPTLVHRIGELLDKLPPPTETTPFLNKPRPRPQPKPEPEPVLEAVPAEVISEV
jgi:GTP-binding protein